MGVDLYCGAFCDDREQEIINEVSAFFQNLESVIPQPAPEIVHYEDSFEVSVFFAADPVVFQFENGQLLVSAKTSNAGPGYHAYLVNLLKQLEQQTSIIWNVEQIEDESGYWDSGDFLSIQSVMADWLHSMSTMVMENTESSDWALSMNIDCLPENGSHFAVYPLGWLEKDFFQGILSASALDDYCNKFFIWWNEGLDAGFYLKYGLYIMWNHINWLPPTEEDEIMSYNNALHCFETAWRMNPKLEFPLAEWYEMASLLGDDSLIETLENAFPGIQNLTPEYGHMRGNMSLFIGDAWKLSIPGKMHRDIEDNTLVYWDQDITLRISHLRANKGDNYPVPAEEFLLNLTENYDCQPYSLPDHPDAKSRILNAQVEEDGRMAYCDTTLFSAVDGCLLIVSCYYDRPEDKDMAMNIINCVKPSQVASS